MSRTDTTLIEFPWALPVVTTRYLTPRARLRRAVRRFLDSPFAQDVKGNLPRIPIAVGGLLVGYVLVQVLNVVVLVATP